MDLAGGGEGTHLQPAAQREMDLWVYREADESQIRPLVVLSAAIASGHWMESDGELLGQKQGLLSPKQELTQDGRCGSFRWRTAMIS